jgi:tetratricopeptide (TPR) repeat protein
MTICQSLSRLALHRLIEDAVRSGGHEAGDAIVAFLTQLDRPNWLGALCQALDRAWQALEIALGGDVPRPGASLVLPPHAVPAVLRQLALSEVRAARGAGALTDGDLAAQGSALAAEVLTVSAVPQQGAVAEAEDALLRELTQQGLSGLVLWLRSSQGLPVLVLAARSFFCQALLELLQHCLLEAPEQTPDNLAVVQDTLRTLASPPGALTLSAPSPAALPAPPARPAVGSAEQLPPPARDTPKLRVVNPVTPPISSRGNQPRPRAMPLWGRRTLRLMPVARRRVVRPQRAALTRPAPAAGNAQGALAFLVLMFVALAVAWHVGNPPGGRTVDPQEAELRRQEEVSRLAKQQAEERRRQEEERQLAQKRDAERRQREEEAAREEARREKALREQQDAQDAKRREAERRWAEQRRAEEEARVARRRAAERLEQARLALERGLGHAARLRDRPALEAFNEALKLDPHNARAHRERGLVWRRLGKNAPALEDFSEAIRRDPADVLAWCNRGELHALEGHHSLALTDFSEAIRLAPKDFRGHRGRGAAYCHLSQYQRAIDDETVAIQLAPQGAWSYLHRANAYRGLNALDKAVEDYTTAIARDRNLAAAYRARAAIYLDRGSYTEASEDYTAAIALGPTTANDYRERSWAYLKMNNWSGCIADCTEVIHLDPEDLTAYKNRGQAHLAIGAHTYAHADFSRVLKSIHDPEAYYQRARCKAALGDIGEAIYDCNDALARNPRLAPAYLLRGTLRIRQGAYTNGRADMDRAYALDPALRPR